MLVTCISHPRDIIHIVQTKKCILNNAIIYSDVCMSFLGNFKMRISNVRIIAKIKKTTTMDLINTNINQVIKQKKKKMTHK